MSSTPRLGMTFTSDMDPRDLVAVARACDRYGLDELWVFEDCFSTGSIPLVTAALAATERIRVGIALAPVPLRNVALLAMDVATLERMHPGRLLPGIGTGVLPWMAQVGERSASPMTRLRESAVALRRLLAGERVTVHGDYVHLDEVELKWAPAVAPPLYVGANGPRMLALAGDVGDGTLLNPGTPDADIAERAAATRAAAQAAGKDSHEVMVLHLVATGARSEDRLAAGLSRWGAPGARAGAAGDAAEIAASIVRLGEAGVTSVSAMQTPDVEDLDAFLRFLGTEVRPLLP